MMQPRESGNCTADWSHHFVLAVIAVSWGSGDFQIGLLCLFLFGF